MIRFLYGNLLVVQLVLLVSSCVTSSRYPLAKSDIKIDTLSICLSGPVINMPVEQHQLLVQSLDTAISEFNRESEFIKAKRCDRSDRSTAYIQFTKYRLINQSQLAIAGINLIGLVALPTAMLASDLPFFVFFWYLPRAYTAYNIYLSEDIDNSKNPATITKKASTGGFLKTTQLQQVYIGEDFTFDLLNFLYEFEIDYAEKRGLYE